MSEEEGMYVAKELLNLSESVYLSYDNLLNYYYSGDMDKYEAELEKLGNLLYREKKHYEKIDDNIVLYLLSELDDSEMLSSIENNLDKYLNIVKLGFSFKEISYFRILNLLRDNYIVNSRLSCFDDTEVFDYEVDEYNNKMLNNIVIENQIFNDFLSLFVANLNSYINSAKKCDVKMDLNIYKYVLVFTYGRNNLDLLSDNHDIDNVYVYSKYLHDMMLYADKEFSYNYDIMKIHFLDRVLYNYLNDYKNNDNEVIKIINKCFMKSIIMLYGEDYNRVNKIYNSEIRTDDKEMDAVVDSSGIIASKVKVLNLNK